MVNMHIEDKKNFTSNLFVKETFDEFYLVEASVTTFNTFTIDGRIQKGFYTDEEYDNMGSPQLSMWKDVKRFCFEIIKGNKMPIKFKIILKAGKNLTEDIVEKSGGTIIPGDVQGLLLNIRFENGSIDCITGTTLNIFSLDKSVEEGFDKYVEKWLLEWG